MVTVSHIVKKLVSDKPFLEEALRSGIISNGNLAEQLHQAIEQELGKKVTYPAIVMALRRYAETLAEKNQTLAVFNYDGEIVMKTNICDFTLAKTPSLITKLKDVNRIANYETGDTLNVIVGNNEVSIITSERLQEKLKTYLKEEKILNTERGLVALTVMFTSDDFMHTPGVVFTILRKLVWENINIYEIITTMMETTLILNKKDSIKAYNALYELVQKKQQSGKRDKQKKLKTK